jgi:hypothetical protein
MQLNLQGTFRSYIHDSKRLYFRRKKDHGRAESMLIGAWALGIRPDDPLWPDFEKLLTDT